MAGLAGGLYAHYARFVSPEVFLFTYTVTMVIMVVAGGKGTLAGPVVGAVLFTVLPGGAPGADLVAVADAALRRPPDRRPVLPAAGDRPGSAGDGAALARPGTPRPEPS